MGEGDCESPISSRLEKRVNLDGVSSTATPTDGFPPIGDPWDVRLCEVLNEGPGASAGRDANVEGDDRRARIESPFL